MWKLSLGAATMALCSGRMGPGRAEAALSHLVGAGPSLCQPLLYWGHPAQARPPRLGQQLQASSQDLGAGEYSMRRFTG